METLDFDDEWGQFAEFCVELFKKCSSDQLLRSQLDLINQFDSYSQASGSKSGIEFLLRDEHIFRCLNIELDMIYSKTDLTNRQPNQLNRATDELPHLPETISICETLEQGRFLKAVKTIPKSSLLIEREPYAVWLKPSLYSTNCYCCFLTLTPLSVKCPSCAIANFCSMKCLCEARLRYGHDVECSVLSGLKHMSAGHLAVKLVLSFGVQKAIAQVEKDADHSYKEIIKLVHHTNKYDSRTRLCDSLGALYLALLVQRMTSYERVDDQLLELTHLLLRHIYQIAVNGIQVVKRNYDNHTECSLGVGLYIHISLLNHSCYSQLSAVFEGNSLKLVTRNRVEEGDELTFNYGPHYKVIKDRRTRRDLLRSFYFFECNCKACEEDWQ